MSDFEKDNELRDKYSDVMGSIADDIRQINLEGKAEELHFEFEEPAADESVFEEPAPEGSYEKFLESVQNIQFDDEQDEPLGGVNTSGEFDAAPLMKSDSIYNTGPISVAENISGFENADSDLDVLSCDECSDLLYDYVSDAVDEADKMAIEAHLKNCENCRLEYYEIKDMISVLSSSKAPAPPIDLVSGVTDRLKAIAPEVKAEHEALKAEGVGDDSLTDKLVAAFALLKSKAGYWIKHANWKIVAPAALSAVLVMGVAGSGLYQVMKSSDEIYDFSDNAAITSAKATARPSISGLDEYVTDDNRSSGTSSVQSTMPPRSAIGTPSSIGGGTAASPSATASSSLPRATVRPSTSTSSGLTLGSGTPARTTSGTTSSANRTTSSSTTANRSTSTGSTSSGTVRAATPTAAPKAYVTPKIILPDIATGIASPTYVAPETVTVNNNPVPDVVAATEAPVVPVAVPTPAPTAAPEVKTASEDSSVTGGGSPAEDIASTASPAPGASASPGPSSSSNPSASPAATLRPRSTAEPERQRNKNGETKSFEEKAKDMDKASVISCEIKDKDVLDEIMDSALGDCSKIAEDGEITLYFTDA